MVKKKEVKKVSKPKKTLKKPKEKKKIIKKVKAVKEKIEPKKAEIKEEIKKKKPQVNIPLTYKLSELSEEQKEVLEKMKYDVGDAIGVIAAQSISEPATQTTLRAYHAMGRTQLVTTRGLPRLLELFDARKVPTTPTMTIHLEEEYNQKEKAKEIAAEIKNTRLKNVIVEDSLDLVNLRVEVALDNSQLKNLNISRDDIINLIRKNIKSINVKQEKRVILVESKKSDTTVKDLQTIRIKLRELHIKGVKGVSQILVEKSGDDWIIRTLGSNIKKILKIEGVDKIKTTTNNIHEIAKVLGIEAARNAIVKETLSTMRDQGVDTDTRHVLLVADAMTRDGEVKAIGRYGIAGEKSSILSRANFEETIKHLSIAAASGDSDLLEGAIENIIVGNLAPIGTGIVKLKVKV